MKKCFSTLALALAISSTTNSVHADESPKAIIICDIAIVFEDQNALAAMQKSSCWKEAAQNLNGAQIKDLWHTVLQHMHTGATINDYVSVAHKNNNKSLAHLISDLTQQHTPNTAVINRIKTLHTMNFNMIGVHNESTTSSLPLTSINPFIAECFGDVCCQPKSISDAENNFYTDLLSNNSIDLSTQTIIFITNNQKEIDAAQKAGIHHCILFINIEQLDQELGKTLNISAQIGVTA